jgi:YD repeat-containing protein
VIDTLGRPINYFYNGVGKLIEVRDFANRSIRLQYDAKNDLVAVSTPAVTGTPTGNNFPNGKTERYTYDAEHRLLTITAPNEVASGGAPRVRITYNTEASSPNAGRIKTLAIGGTNASKVPAGGTITYEYRSLALPSSPNDVLTPVRETTVTDRNGNRTVYQFNQLNNIVSVNELTNRNVRPVEPDYKTIYAWNGDYEPLGTTLPQGNSSSQTYDAANPDRFQQGNLLSSTRLPDTRGGDQSFITTSQTYEPIYNQVRTMTEARGNDPNYVAEPTRPRGTRRHIPLTIKKERTLPDWPRSSESLRPRCRHGWPAPECPWAWGTSMAMGVPTRSRAMSFASSSPRFDCSPGPTRRRSRARRCSRSLNYLRLASLDR